MILQLVKCTCGWKGISWTEAQMHIVSTEGFHEVTERKLAPGEQLRFVL